jgi:hypothetical protein
MGAEMSDLARLEREVKRLGAGMDVSLNIEAPAGRLFMPRASHEVGCLYTIGRTRFGYRRDLGFGADRALARIADGLVDCEDPKCYLCKKGDPAPRSESRNSRVFSRYLWSWETYLREVEEARRIGAFFDALRAGLDPKRMVLRWPTEWRHAKRIFGSPPRFTQAVTWAQRSSRNHRLDSPGPIGMSAEDYKVIRRDARLPCIPT